MNYDQLLARLQNDLPQTQAIFSNGFYFWGLIICIVLAFIAFLFWVFPMYSVWASKKRGQAELAEANFAEQVAIAEATARLKSAEMNREAEEIEAKAVANSIDIIGNSLETNQSYLRWQWIKSISDTEDQIIYVPTEANLPILEANRNKQ